MYKRQVLIQTEENLRYCEDIIPIVTQLRISEAARLLGVSDDTLRRWIEAGRLAATPDPAGRKVVDGAELARFAEELHADVAPDGGHDRRRSARNRFTGLVTRVLSDRVMSQVELQCGPYRVVALISTCLLYTSRCV